MSTLTDQLHAQAQHHAGTDLAKLLTWAALHIAEQDEALAEVRTEHQAEEAQRIKMEQNIHAVRAMLDDVSAMLDYSRPVNIELASDHAPHINLMAAAGVMPYAKTPARPRAAT